VVGAFVVAWAGQLAPDPTAPLGDDGV
jgi:hypothetical protein